MLLIIDNLHLRLSLNKSYSNQDTTTPSKKLVFIKIFLKSKTLQKVASNLKTSDEARLQTFTFLQQLCKSELEKQIKSNGVHSCTAIHLEL